MEASVSCKMRRMARPREFDEGKVLDRALATFWEHGYEGTSIADLTAAMGINRPSLYATFGDKESLFRRAIERYAEGPMSYLSEALEQPTARQVIDALLYGTVDYLADPTHPKGCMTVQGGITCGVESQAIKDELISRRIQGETRFRQRFERARAEGDLGESIDPSDLARYLVSMMNGLGIQAVNGATVEEMNRVVDMSLRAINA